MRKIILLLVGFASCNITSAQNLVPNPSFEDTVSCPFSFNQVSFSNGWSSYRTTPDYFNECSNTTWDVVDVPKNWFGFQRPASGKSYCGFAINDQDYREILGCQLSIPLSVGTKYYLSMKVSLADSSQYAKNKIGITFSTISYSSINPVPLNNNPQVYSMTIITDTANWVSVFSSFLADSTYQYIIIGNFFTDSLIDTLPVPNSTSTFSGLSYYYIDDICVSTDSSYTYNYSYIESNNRKNKKNIAFFPNPTNDYIAIKDEDESIEQVMLCNIIGQVLPIVAIRSNQNLTLDLNNLPHGIYRLLIYRKNLTMASQSIVKL